jgi:hypothetical protein
MAQVAIAQFEKQASSPLGGVSSELGAIQRDLCRGIGQKYVGVSFDVGDRKADRAGDMVFLVGGGRENVYYDERPVVETAQDFVAGNIPKRRGNGSGGAFGWHLKNTFSRSSAASI